MRHVLAIDAGGSHTRCCLAADNGHILSYGRGGPANTNFVPPEASSSAIEHAISRALTPPEYNIEAAVVSGAHLPPETSATVAKHAKTEHIIRADEFEVCLAAGLHGSGNSGVVIMSGTGSFCKGRNVEGREKYVGAWGPLIGDEGSGYDIGREALAAISKACDGRDDRTGIRDLVFSHFTIREIHEFKKRLYAPPLQRHEIAELAECVFAAAGAGDAIATRILGDAGARLAHLASPVLSGLFAPDESFPVVLCGGILSESGSVTGTLIPEIEKMRPRADVIVSDLSPAAGALILGLQSIGVRIDANTLDNLIEGDKRMGASAGSKENRDL